MRAPLTTSRPVKRLPFLDWSRGFAVVAMVLWHTGDAWLVPGLKAGQGFGVLRFMGGLAAPTFLFLAGTGAALAARPPTSGEAARLPWEALARGFQIVIVGYALRLQTWLIDAQALITPSTLRAWLPLGVGYGALYLGAGALARGTRSARRFLVGGAVAVAAGLVQVPAVAPGRIFRLLQVDVLQCIGMALVLLALLQHGTRFLSRPVLATAIGVGVALLTEPVAKLVPGALPIPLAAYLGRLQMEAGIQPGLFPLFPWFAYACFGAALGAALKRAEVPGAAALWASLLGATLGLCTSEALSPVHRLLRDHAWAVAPVRTAFRAGIVLTLIGLSYAWVARARGRVLSRFGRTSLRIYWAHMLFAYGVLGRAVQHRLSYLHWLALALGLLGLMWLLAGVSGVPKLGRRGPKIRLEPQGG